ncbi:MAG: ATP-binding cassette domain-containing protein [Acidobacteria bacterium]|nr:ATP-binding cassette domain-containing protein [Acidobacteriota bacterium]
MIKVEGLTKRYARATAVDNISFEVDKGQIVGFLGPNGAGKTTTMRMLTCFMPPSGGRAEVAGFDVVKSPMEVKKRIGYLPETPPLYPEMEVGEYLDFVGKLKGVPSADLAKRIQEVSERCAVADVRNKLISKLSKGYKQRVGLAQAIIHNPDVLILDEPTSGLDPKQIMETRDLIRSLAGDHTIILSTHILTEVEQTCETAIIIAKGKVMATDSVAALKNRRAGGSAVLVEVEAVSEGQVREKLERVSGVSRVVHKPSGTHGIVTFEVEGLSGKNIRPEIARAVVESGWSLNELRPLGMSLEEVFLQLTSGTKAAEHEAATAAPAVGDEEKESE